MHRVLVDEKKWLSEDRFLAALNFCMLLPGPEAMQLATYAGWTLHGWRGGLAAGTLFVLPGALVVLVLSMIYAAFGQVPFVAALFFGIKAAVLAIVIEALLRVARRALKFKSDWWIAGAAFIALYVFAIPFPLIILAAAIIGYFRATSLVQPAAKTGAIDWQGTLATTALWLALWLVPLTGIIWGFGPSHVLAQVALFFSKLAVVTFGGAYAVLSYMAQQAVENFGWLAPQEMIDGLGLAETTPGPLILVTEFVGYMAGYRFAGGLWGGIAGAVITLWMTFVPCFLWIMAGAPYIARLQNMPHLSGALAAVTSAVVGVILNLTIWFALHVLFRALDRTAFGLVPQIGSLDVPAVILSAIAAAALFAFHQGIFRTLLLCALLGMLWRVWF
jgi:chromate transporter